MRKHLKKLVACTLASAVVLPVCGATNYDALDTFNAQTIVTEDGVTRADFAQLLDLIMGYDIQATNTYSDLGNDVYTSAVLKLAAEGVMIGANNKIRPLDLVTWEEAVVMIGRAFSTEQLNNSVLHSNKDTATWALGYANSMVKQGFIQADTFEPKAHITSSDLIALIEKLVVQPKPMSKDTAAIQASMLKMPTLVEVPYDEDVTYHSDSREEKSHAFTSMYCSVGEVNLEEYGYVEKEFFMSGTANVYGLDESLGLANNVPVIDLADNDYTTRLLVRFPEDASEFTGRVYIDILNASSGVDLEDTWRRSYDHIMQEGHAYIGITSKSLTSNALKKFDPERYEALDWLDKNGREENGLVWDMLGQLGTFIKSDQGTSLFGKEVEATYLCGQSQSGFYLNTFLNVFYPYINNINKGEDLFDGYLNLVGWVTTKLAGGNDADETRDVSVTPGFAKTEEPFVVIMSEWEASLSAYGYVEDKNEADWKFRLYEIAGAPHSDPTSPIIPNNEEISAAHATGKRRDPKEYYENHYETDLNIDPFVDAILENMHEWSINGIEMPSASDKWITFTEDKTVAKDEYGNGLGGIRAPMIEAPIATYYPGRNGNMETDGSMVYFTEAQLQQIYPQGKAQYLGIFKAQAEQLLKDRYITSRRFDEYMKYAEEMNRL